MNLTSILKAALPAEWIGRLEYYRFPERRIGLGGPFNGQSVRGAMVRELLTRFSPSVIIETGTFRGRTTLYLAETGVPVYTVEANGRNYGFARAQLRRFRNVSLVCSDSREALRAWFEGPLREMSGRTVFAYLDAHWNADLPLAKELDLVFAHCPSIIVMIDDFQVPGDPGYRYDDYGPGQALNADYIAPTMVAHGLRAFYPSTPSTEENGRLRGCVVLLRRGPHADALASSPLFRENDRPSQRAAAHT